MLARFHSPGATPTEASLAGKRQLPADRDAVCVSSGFPTPLGVFKMEGPAHGPLQPGRGSWGAGELGALLPSKQIFSVTFEEAESLES